MFRKSGLGILCVIMINMACSEREIVITEDQLPSDIFYLPNEIRPFSGICRMYYTDTNVVKEKMSFHKGLLHGISESYFKNGKLKRRGSYHQGKLNGIWQAWNKDGKILYKVTYKNDSLSGEYTAWYSNGNIKEKGLYKNNSKLGQWKVYDENGIELVKKKLGSY